MSACTCCASKYVGAIDTALANGESKSGIARRFGVSRWAVQRHAEHMVEGVLVESTAPDADLVDLDGRLVALEAVLQRALDQAIASGKTTALLGASKEIRMTVESIAKLRGAIDTRPVINVLQVPEFRTVMSALLAALADFPEARFAAAKALAELEGGAA